MKTESEKFIQMTETPIPKLITKLGIPTILSMLVTSFYNMADTYFVGKIEGTPEQVTSATGAAAVVFSLMAILQAIGFFFGQGSGTYIARELGNKQHLNAEKMAACAFVCSVFTGAIIAVLGLVFIKQLAYLLGSTETILPYAVDYMRYILIGAPLLCGSLVLNNQLRFQGNAFIAMIGIISGAVLNVGLDAAFILWLKMGTAGAGLATAIGQGFGFIVLFIGMRLGNNVKIRIKNISRVGAFLKEIARGGMPSLARQGLSGAATLCLNFAAKSCGGDPTIAAMGVVARVMHFCFYIVLGFGQGFQPVCGYNYGAKKYGRVKEGFYFCLKASCIVSVFAAGVMALFAPQIIAVFRNDARVIETGALALRLQCASFLFIPLVTYCNMMLQTIGRVVPATLLSAARQGLFFIPLVFLLSGLFNVNGLAAAQPVADTLSFALALYLTVRQIKIFNKLELEEKETEFQDLNTEL